MIADILMFCFDLFSLSDLYRKRALFIYGLDFYELAALIDTELDELERISDETRYLYNSTMGEADAAAILNEGCEKIPSTDGTCLYQKVSGNTAYYISRRTDQARSPEHYSSGLFVITWRFPVCIPCKNLVGNFSKSALIADHFHSHILHHAICQNHRPRK